MKRNLLFIIIAALCMLISRAGVITHSETFSPSGWSFLADTVDSTPYTHVTHEGLDYISEPGKPQLPVKYVQLMVPYNATNITVSCSYNLRRTRVLDAKVLPVEVPQIADETASAIPVIYEDSTIYGVNALFPAVRAEVVSDDYFMGDNHVITVALYPMQYNPIAGQVVYYSGLTASVSYDTGTAPANLLHRNNEKARNEDLAQLATIIQNPSQIQAFKAPARVNNTQGNNNQSSLVESYEYTIITTKELQPAFKRLIAIKRQKGYSTGSVCIEDIMQNPNVNGGDSIYNESNNLVSVLADSAGVIRQYLKRAFENGTRYVLMGGTKVPYRNAYCRLYNSDAGKYDTIATPTDWYYSNLIINWNHPNKPIAGYFEYGDTTLKLDSNLYLGRIMADSVQDVYNYLDKLFRYEFKPGNSDMSYLSRQLTIRGADNLGSSQPVADAYQSIGMNVSLINQVPNTYPTGKEVIDSLKNYGMISVHGHGNPHSTTVNYNKKTVNHRICPLDLDDQTMREKEYGNGLDFMDNKFNPNISYSWACTTMPFDIFRGNGTVYTGWNMGQSFTLGKDYGGVAYFGDTRNGYSSFKDQEVAFAKNLYRYYNAGIAEAKSKNHLPKAYYAWYYALVHNLMGEPELSIWTKEPINNDNISIVRNDNAISISGLSQEDGDISIAYCDDKITGKVITTNSSITIPNISPSSLLIIYGHNYLPFVAPLSLQDCHITNFQHVIVPSALIGRNIDNNRMQGDVVIDNGAKYVIESANGVIISNGFTVKSGSSFEVILPTNPIIK